MLLSFGIAGMPDVETLFRDLLFRYLEVTMLLPQWLYVPIEPFLWHPERVALIAGLFFVTYFWLRCSRRCARCWPMLIAAVTWAAYAPWEWYCKSQGADIRIDLGFIAPGLWTATVGGIIFSFVPRRRRVERA